MPLTEEAPKARAQLFFREFYEKTTSKKHRAAMESEMECTLRQEHEAFGGWGPVALKYRQFAEDPNLGATVDLRVLASQALVAHSAALNLPPVPGELYFKCRGSTALIKLMRAYCQRTGLTNMLEQQQLVFCFNGAPIRDGDRPVDIDLESGDSIDLVTAAEFPAFQAFVQQGLAGAFGTGAAEEQEEAEEQ